MCTMNRRYNTPFNILQINKPNTDLCINFTDFLLIHLGISDVQFHVDAPHACVYLADKLAYSEESDELGEDGS